MYLNTNRFIVFSVILHGIFFLLISMRLSFFTTPRTLGFPDSSLLYSYVITEQPQKTLATSMQQNSQVVHQKSSKKMITSSKKPELALKSMPTQATSVSTASAKPQGLPTQTLLALLHQAIQKHQQYPENAQEMRRQGRVTVKFVLNPDGTVSNVALIKSSGTDSLDHAALAAINDAAPYVFVNHYIHSSQEYRIDVVFELS